MQDHPLVSIIVPTYNSAPTLEACLRSIGTQSYLNLELIVIDNNSTDQTKAIAQQFTPNVHNKGPERSAQRNFGVSIAKGKYVAIIDSDMELSQHVIASAVAKMQQDPDIGALVIPEESFGSSFWAHCKQLERSFYVGVSWMEAARFFTRDIYLTLGGYNERLISGEDWDLSQRAGKISKLGRIDDMIMHNEGRLRLGKTLRKKYYYAQKFSEYLKANISSGQVGVQSSVLSRYKLYFSKPKKLFKQPLLGLGMLFMKTCELGVGGLGFLAAKLHR